MGRKRFYAWRIGDKEGIETSWEACKAIVHGQNARYKGFMTREEAEAWLRAGARYGPWDDGETSPWLERVKTRRRTRRQEGRRVRPWRRSGAEASKGLEGLTVGLKRGPLPKDAIYFDSGTGYGRGTEVNVTDAEGRPLAYLVAPEGRITPEGTVLLSPGRSNNYGELLACLLAIRVARMLGRKVICGDSRTALDYWSKGHVKEELIREDPDLGRLVKMTVQERAAFEKEGGVFFHVPGNRNPADLGFHR